MAAGLDERGVVVPCGSCGGVNRLAYGALDRPARCGQCKTALPAPGVPLDVPSPAVFDAAAAGTLPLVVDFWAAWCGPCRMVAPELERVARSRAGRALVVKVDIDAQPALAERFRIQSVPTLAVLVQGREAARVAGVRPAAEIERLLEQALLR
jgi:thioredoxin 2